MEKRGSGLTRICKETRALEGYKNELHPIFKSTPTQFQTVIFAACDKENVGENVGDLMREKLTDRQRIILDIISKSPAISARQMSETLSVSSRTVERELSILRDMGLLQHEGKDNKGHWKIMMQ